MTYCIAIASESLYDKLFVIFPALKGEVDYLS